MSIGSRATEHESAAIKAFVVREKRERLLGFLAKPKTRKRFVQELNHFRLFDHRFAAPVSWQIDPSLKLWDRHVHGIANICRKLQSKGAGNTCWVMSDNEELDGRELDLEWVLEKAIDGQTSTILSCIPGKLALFVGEREMLLLVR
jgi:hypothetical protein